MINSVINLLIILTFQQQKTVKSAVGPKSRLDILRHELLGGIENEQIRSGGSSGGVILEDFYKFVGVERDDGPIKPIMQHIDNKKKHKHKHNTGKAANMTAPKHKRRLRMRHTIPTTKTTTIQRTSSKITPADVFIRRFVDDGERNKPVKWAHCVHLITPYLKYYKDRVTFNRVGVKDATVIKLIKLLSEMNTSDNTREEIPSIINEISNLHIRIINWDINAINALFNVIIPEADHNFRTLKAGLKNIFSRWHLNISNIATFGDQMKIIQPPCIKTSEFGGSTKSPLRPSQYTKPTTKDSDDEDSD